jgi:hypothetical protein
MSATTQLPVFPDHLEAAALPMLTGDSSVTTPRNCHRE